jgi:hypothetical protein
MILRDARIYFGEHELSADHNQINLEVGVVELDNLRFGMSAESVAAGLGRIELSGAGFVRLDAGFRAALRQNIGLADVPVTLISGDPLTDDVAVEFFRAMEVSYRAGAQVGQLLAFSWTARGQGYLPAFGHSHAVGAVTLNGTSTPQQLGALLAGEVLFAALHVTGVTGTDPTLDVAVQSDNAVGFPSPTPQGSFAQVTGPGSEFLVIPGPIADDWWRGAWTVGGTDNPSFDVALVLGVQQQ